MRMVSALLLTLLVLFTLPQPVSHAAGEVGPGVENVRRVVLSTWVVLHKGTRLGSFTLEEFTDLRTGAMATFMNINNYFGEVTMTGADTYTFSFSNGIHGTMTLGLESGSLEVADSDIRCDLINFGFGRRDR